MSVTNQDLARLIVSLEVSTTRLYNGLRRAQQQTNQTANAIQSRLTGMASSIDRTFANLGQRMSASLTGPLATVGAAFSVREILQYADTWTEAGNRIRAAGEIVGLQARPLEDIRKLADDSRAGFNETVQLYSRLLRSAGNVAESELEIAKATDIVNKAFKAGGAATSEMNAGILQLGQGLASGFLQGDELRSVRENAPVLAQVIADFFKVSIGGLKELGSQGELTSDKVFKAILSGQDQIEAAFNATNRTIGDSFRLVENSLIQYIGTADKTNGVTATITQALGALADNFDAAADIVLKFAAIIAGAVLGRSLVAMVGTIGSAITVLGQLTLALRTAGTASAAFGTLFASALGPLAIILGGTAAFAFQHFAAESAKAAAQIGEVTAQADALGFAAGKTAKEIREAALSTAQLTEETKKLAEAERARDVARARDANQNLREGAVFDNYGAAFSDNSSLKSAAAIAQRAWIETMKQAGSATDVFVNTELNKLAEGLQKSTIPAQEVVARLRELQQEKISINTVNLLDALDKVALQLAQTEFVLNVKADTTEVDAARAELVNFLNSFSDPLSTELSDNVKAEFEKIVKEFDGSTESADETIRKIEELARLNPELNPIITEIIRLTGAFTNLANEASRASAEAQKIASEASFKTSLRNQAEGYVSGLENKGAEVKTTNAFLTEQKRLLGLKEDELKLEKELKLVKKEAAEAGANISDEKALSLAKDRLDLEKQYKESKSTKKDETQKFDAELEKQRVSNEALEKEAEFLKTLNPLTREYTQNIAAWRYEQELLTKAEQEGVELTPARVEAIKAVAAARAEGDIAIERSNEANQKLIDTTQEWLDLSKTAMRSFIDDLIEGKTAAEALGGVLQQLGSFLIDAGLNAAFGKIGGDTGFASLFNVGKRAGGGPVSAGQPYVVGEKRPELFVPTQDGVIIPRVPNSSTMGGGTSVAIPISIDATGADAAGLARLQAEIIKLKSEIPNIVKGVTQKRSKKGW